MIDWYYELGRKQAGPVSPEKLSSASSGSLQASSWARLCARLLDVSILSAIVAITFLVIVAVYMPSHMLGFISPIDPTWEILFIPFGFINLLFVPLYIVIAAITMRVNGTTIGKAVVGIKVQRISGHNTLPFLLKREFKVWLLGLGLTIPFISVVTMAKQHRNIVKNGSAGYDQNIARVTGGSSRVRCAVAAAIAAAYIFGLSYLGAVDWLARDEIYVTQSWTNTATGESATLSKSWIFEDLKAELGSTFLFSSEDFMAEVYFDYEPLDEDGVDPAAYGQIIAEYMADDIGITSEWAVVKFGDREGVRATGVQNSMPVRNVEITVVIVGRSAWITIVYVFGQPAETFLAGEDMVQSLFGTIKDINVPTGMPCGDDTCLSFLRRGNAVVAVQYVTRSDRDQSAGWSNRL